MGNLIGFMGFAQSGKTTCANLMNEKYDTAYTIPVAGALKEGLARMGIRKESNPDLYREAAQFLGTNIVRKHDVNWWVNLHAAEVEQALEMADLVTVDDVRFKNEVDSVSDLGGVMVYIYTGDRLDLTKEMYKHPSEVLAHTLHTFCQQLSVKWDEVNIVGFSTPRFGRLFVVNNSRSIDKLPEALDKLYEHISFHDEIRIIDCRVDSLDKGLGC